MSTRPTGGSSAPVRVGMKVTACHMCNGHAELGSEQWGTSRTQEIGESKWPTDTIIG